MLRRMMFCVGVMLMSLTLLTNCGSDSDSVVTLVGQINSHSTGDAYLEDLYEEIAEKEIFLDGFMMLPLLYSDECKYTGVSNSAWQQASEFDMSPENDRIKDLFLDFYSLNADLNQAFTQLDTTNDETLTEDVIAGLQGEARALRGLIFMYLSNYWGEVPIITQDNETADSLKEVSTLQEIFELIEADFLFASENISKNYLNTTRQRISESAAEALLARLYLYNGDWALAKQYADKVINESGRTLESTVNGIYSLSSSENVWVLPEEEEDVSLAIYFLQTFSNGQHVVVPRSNDFFESGDVRRDVALSQPGTTILKYDDIFGNSDPIYMVRLSEMYLIAAEAACRANNDFDGAEVYINALRSRAQLSDIELNAGNFEDLILAERRNELSFEGFHRWMDLKRTGNDISVLEPYGYEATDQYWPFATVFLDIFKAIEQNDGY